MTDEPRRHPLYMLLLALCALGTVPFLFVGSDAVWLMGLPLWLWSSIAFTVGLSALIVWGIYPLAVAANYATCWLSRQRRRPVS